MSYQEYREMVQEYFPLACQQVTDLVKGLELGDNIEVEEEINKNFVVDIYDFQVEADRVAGAFVKQAQGVSLYQENRFVKFLPLGMAWIGNYGKMEVISNVAVDNPLLKNGIWFIYDEGKSQVIPVFPEKNGEDRYEELETKQVQDLLEQIFNS